MIDDSLFPPHVRPAAVIIGVKGSNHARMQDESACCVQLRGRGISSHGTPGADEPMHLWVKYDEHKQLQKVKDVLDEIIRSCDAGPHPRGGNRSDRGGESPSGGASSAQQSASPPAQTLPPPQTAPQFLYTLHIVLHQKAESIQSRTNNPANQSIAGVWIDQLPTVYNQFFGFPFDIDRFFPPSNHTEPYQYLIELLTSMHLLLTVKAEILESDDRGSSRELLYAQAVLPAGIPWPEFERLAGEQSRLLLDQESSGGELQSNSSTAATGNVAGAESLDDILGPPSLGVRGMSDFTDSPAGIDGEEDGGSGGTASMDLDDFLTVGSGIHPTSGSNNDSSSFAGMGSGGARHPSPGYNSSSNNTQQHSMIHRGRDLGMLSKRDGARSTDICGRVDIPDTPLLLLLQALHRMLIVLDFPVPLDRVENEFQSMWGMPLDVTIMGDKSVVDFLSGFPDVVVVREDHNSGRSTSACLPVVNPDFRQVAERLSRMLPDPKLQDALKSMAQTNAVHSKQSRNKAEDRVDFCTKSAGHRSDAVVGLEELEPLSRRIQALTDQVEMILKADNIDIPARIAYLESDSAAGLDVRQPYNTGELPHGGCNVIDSSSELNGSRSQFRSRDPRDKIPNESLPKGDFGEVHHETTAGANWRGINTSKPSASGMIGSSKATNWNDGKGSDRGASSVTDQHSSFAGRVPTEGKPNRINPSWTLGENRDTGGAVNGKSYGQNGWQRHRNETSGETQHAFRQDQTLGGVAEPAQPQESTATAIQTGNGGLPPLGAPHQMTGGRGGFGNEGLSQVDVASLGSAAAQTTQSQPDMMRQLLKLLAKRGVPGGK
eukprot:Lankesteria_metandrocarpae@DN797_c0_g1_i1.p1